GPLPSDVNARVIGKFSIRSMAHWEAKFDWPCDQFLHDRVHWPFRRADAEGLRQLRVTRACINEAWAAGARDMAADRLKGISKRQQPGKSAAITSAWRIRTWRRSVWGCPGRRPSTAQRNPDTQRGPWHERRQHRNLA